MEAATPAPYLPALRRYAHILAGGAASGDAYVRATLAALLAGDAALAAASSSRLGLYRLLHAIWFAASPPRERREDTRDTLIGRAVYLLVRIEGFTPDEAAFITARPVQRPSSGGASVRPEGLPRGIDPRAFDRTEAWPWKRSRRAPATKPLALAE